MTKNILIVVLFVNILFLALSDKCLAKAGERDTVNPDCTRTGDISCPKGFKPNCPKQYKPKCIFFSGKQHPACLADGADGTFYNYRLDKITCKK